MWTWWTLVISLATGALVSSLHYALQDFSLVKMKELTDRHGGEKAVDAVLSDVDGQLLATGALRAILNILITVAVLLLFGVFHIEQALTEEGVERAVTVRFLNEVGEVEERDFVGLWATSVQHQIDHLNGRMFIDHLSPVRRKMLVARAEKLRKRG